MVVDETRKYLHDDPPVISVFGSNDMAAVTSLVKIYGVVLLNCLEHC